MKNAPFYIQAAAEIRNRILEGELSSGDCLPTEAALTAKLQVSRSTVRKALQYLEESGVVSKIHGKKRFVLEQRPGSPVPGPVRTVLCIGDSPARSRFSATGYDFLYNAMALELQRRNIRFPKFLCRLNTCDLPELLSSMDFRLVFLMTSTPSEFQFDFRCPVVQNMERYEDNADLVIRYDSLPLVRSVVQELLSLGKKRFRIFYHDIKLPFLDHLYQNLLRCFNLCGPDAVVTRGVSHPDGTLDASMDCARDEVVILDASEIGDYLNACRDAGVAIPEEQIIVSFGTAGAQRLPARPHCRRFSINYLKIARIAADVIEEILNGRKFAYNVSIADWYSDQGKY